MVTQINRLTALYPGSFRPAGRLTSLPMGIQTAGFAIGFLSALAAMLV